MNLPEWGEGTNMFTRTNQLIFVSRDLLVHRRQESMEWKKGGISR